MALGRESMYEDELTAQETAEYDGWCRMIPKCGGHARRAGVRAFGNTFHAGLFLGKTTVIPNPFSQNTKHASYCQSGAVRYSGSRLRLLPKAGHFVQWEQASATNQAIREFLEE
ncbi:MAG: hypothetical protein IPM98_11625 [Lewinellaceae bacterium]|nr:hypothetical protein [Lewinellaceae bacterium]